MVRLAPLLLLALSSTAHAVIDLNQLKALIDSGQTKKAYEYASQEVTKYEGDPNFDYYYGIAAIDSGHASEGVFALNRVLLADPDNHAARLELGRGYFILEEYARARQEFETALEADPPEDTKKQIESYLDAISTQEGRYQTTQSAFVELGLGTDSNANSGPDITSVNLGLVTIPLDTASQETDDTFTELAGNYKISTPVSPGTKYFASVAGNLRSNSDHSELDTTTFTVDTGFEFFQAQNTYTVDLIIQQFNLDGEDYRFLTGLNGNWRHNLSQQSVIQTFVQFVQQEFDGQESRDADTITFGTTYSKKFSTAFTPVLSAGIYLGFDSPKQDSDIAKQSTERDYYGLLLGSVFGFTENTSGQVKIIYQTSEYGLAPTFPPGPVREDDYLSTTLDYTWLFTKKWSMSARANIIKNTSNNILFEYDRTLISANLRYRMK